MEEQEKLFMSVEEIDAELEKEFAQADEEPSEELEQEPVAEEVVETEDAQEPEVVKTEEQKQDKPSKEAQKDYNFAKLRSEKEEAERKLTAQIELMKKLAEASGYDNVEEYRDMLETRLIEEEAKKKGISPELYKELSEAKSKVQKLEQEKKESDNQRKLEAFSKEIANVIQQYELEESVGDEIVKAFGDLGYTLETLLSVPHPEVLIKGVLSDKLLNKTLKETKKKERIDSVDTKSIPNADVPVKTIDEIIDEEMAVYAKSRGLKYLK